MSSMMARSEIGKAGLVMMRHLVSAALGLLVTAGLFFLMQHLISMGDAEVKDRVVGKVIDFVRVRPQTPIEQKKRELPNRPPPAEQPSAPQLKMSQPSGLSAAEGGGVMSVAAMAPSADMLKPKIRGGPQLGPPTTTDAPAIPLVRVEPQYPPNAARKGIQGWVRMRFDISPEGKVVNPVVVAASPPGVFDTYALRAIKKWKYRPKIVKGSAVARRGVQVKLLFRLDR